MAWWEVRRYIAGIRRAERTQWQTTRLHSFWILSALGAKLTSPSDLIKFDFDDNEENAGSLSEEEIKSLQEAIRQENAKSQA